MTAPSIPELIAKADLSKMPLAEKREMLALLEQYQKHEDATKLYRYAPYPKQKDFHDAGALQDVRERLLMSGNQLGKTWCAANETAMHLTGQYPDWWQGKRFKQPTTGWAAGLTSQGVRDTIQRLLLGQVGEWGTGTIPGDCVIETKRAAHGVSDAVETILVKHISGGTSRVTMKTYVQGRETWQGETLDFVWLDEEPPPEIYFEGITRTNATKGIVYMTFTPLLGMTATVKRFILEKAPGTHVTRMTLDDCGHYTASERAAILVKYPEHERKARAQGIPTMGSGGVFASIDEDAIKESSLQIPDHWPRIVGIDFGWDHPTAAVWTAWDRDSDTVHIYDCYRVRQATPLIHAAAIKMRGAWVPVVWPHDGLAHDRNSGQTLADQYRSFGLNMLKEKFSNPPQRGEKEGSGGNGVEAGVMELVDRMQTGRLRVAKRLDDWFEESRLYHRKDGVLVKEGDDLMSATRYAVMSLRHAKTRQLPKQPRIAPFQPQDPGFGCLG